jgi:hypothetical protein
VKENPRVINAHVIATGGYSMADRKSFAERAANRCKHFTGIQHDVCKAGVAYKDVRDESTRPYGFPCFADESRNAVCAKRELTTRDEAEAEEREFQAAFARVKTCRSAIKKNHGEARGLHGEMPCPTECGGTLHYSISGYNGHIHGDCTTAGCASWME